MLTIRPFEKCQKQIRAGSARGGQYHTDADYSWIAGPTIICWSYTTFTKDCFNGFTSMVIESDISEGVDLNTSFYSLLLSYLVLTRFRCTILSKNYEVNINKILPPT